MKTSMKHCWIALFYSFFFIEQTIICHKLPPTHYRLHVWEDLSPNLTPFPGCILTCGSLWLMDWLKCGVRCPRKVGTDAWKYISTSEWHNDDAMKNHRRSQKRNSDNLDAPFCPRFHGFCPCFFICPRCTGFCPRLLFGFCLPATVVLADFIKNKKREHFACR